MKSTCFLVAFVSVAVGCGDSTGVPKPPTAAGTTNSESNNARAPQQPATVPAVAPKRSAPTNPTGIASTAQIPPATPKSDAAALKVSSADSDAKIVEIAGFVMPKPAGWQWQTPSMQFRALQYSVPGVGESGAAEVVFSVFAAGDGGPIDMNIKRWVGQFRNDDGSEAAAKIEDRTVSGLPVKWIELAGRYQGMGQAAPRPDMMQLGAILQAPDRTIFIRLVGSRATVEAARKDFEAMVAGVTEPVTAPK